MPSLSAGSATIPFRVVNPANGVYALGDALIDTGASICILDTAIIQALGVVQAGTMQVEGVYGSAQPAPVYVVSVDLGTHGFASNIQVVGDSIQQRLGYVMLIGDNLLAKGWFAEIGSTGTFELQIGQPGTPFPPLGWPLWVGGGLMIGGLVALGLAYREERMVLARLG